MSVRDNHRRTACARLDVAHPRENGRHLHEDPSSTQGSSRRTSRGRRSDQAGLRDRLIVVSLPTLQTVAARRELSHFRSSGTTIHRSGETR